MRKILAVTGTRADYGIYKPVFDAIEASNQLELSLVVTGMHLSTDFGHTVDIIEADGFAISAKLDTLSSEDTPEGTKQFMEKTEEECVEVFTNEKPDIVLVLGDRTEMLAAAKAASNLSIPIAHIHGGEKSGSLDDEQRHAITKLSSIHLTSAQPHAVFIKELKPEEDPSRIYIVGAPALDSIASVERVPKDTLYAMAHFAENRPTVLLVQHPDTLEDLSTADQLQPTLDALRDLDAQVLIIGSNADAGGREMNDILKAFAEGRSGCTFFMTVSHQEYLSWLNSVDVLVGNSSSGIIEAASFGLPVVNIGQRQRERTRSGNVVDVDYDAEKIAQAVTEALSTGKKTYENAYGQGDSAKRIVQIFEEISL